MRKVRGASQATRCQSAEVLQVQPRQYDQNPPPENAVTPKQQSSWETGSAQVPKPQLEALRDFRNSLGLGTNASETPGTARWVLFCALVSSLGTDPEACYIEKAHGSTGGCSEEPKFSLLSPDPFCEARAVSRLLNFNLGSSCEKDKEHRPCSEVLQPSCPLQHRKH